MKLRAFTGVAAACALALTGCGGGHTATVKVTTTTTTTTSAPAPVTTSRCVPGNSFMGCSLPAPGFASPRLAAPAGRKFVDVSDWQPSIDWGAVKRSGVFAAVVKAGEGLHPDPTFESHLGGAKAAGLDTMAYWFVRPVGCSAQAAAIRRYVPNGLRLELDIEVPGASGYAACLKSLVVGAYTSEGTWPGGSGAGLPLWDATFGPSPALGGLDGFGKLVAWQYTSTASIPGIPGSSDENVDLGMFPKPPPPLPKCFTHRITKSACAAAKKKIASDQKGAASSQRAYAARGCPTLSQRVNWYSTQLRKHPKVKTASRKRALAASRKAFSQRSCATFHNRVVFYTGVAATLKAQS